MTSPVPTPVADPRVGPLVALVQTLLQEYQNMATTTAGHLPDRDRAVFAAHVQKFGADVGAAILEINDHVPQAQPGE